MWSLEVKPLWRSSGSKKICRRQGPWDHASLGWGMADPEEIRPPPRVTVLNLTTI